MYLSVGLNKVAFVVIISESAIVVDWSRSFRPESRTPGVDCRGRF